MLSLFHPSHSIVLFLFASLCWRGKLERGEKGIKRRDDRKREREMSQGVPFMSAPTHAVGERGEGEGRNGGEGEKGGSPPNWIVKKRGAFHSVHLESIGFRCFVLSSKSVARGEREMLRLEMRGVWGVQEPVCRVSDCLDVVIQCIEYCQSFVKDVCHRAVCRLQSISSLLQPCYDSVQSVNSK